MSGWLRRALGDLDHSITGIRFALFAARPGWPGDTPHPAGHPLDRTAANGGRPAVQAIADFRTRLDAQRARSPAGEAVPVSAEPL